MNRRLSKRAARGFSFLSLLAAQICLSTVSSGFTPSTNAFLSTRPRYGADSLDVMTRVTPKSAVRSAATAVQDVQADTQAGYAEASIASSATKEVDVRQLKQSVGRNNGYGLPLRVKEAVRDPSIPECVEEVSSLSDFQSDMSWLHGDDEMVVVVRFYSPYCRACKAMEQPFYRMAKQYTEQEHNVKFVQVRITNENADLHERLGIATLPFVQMYHLDAESGAELVEQLRVPKSQIQNFARILHTYLVGECELIEYHDEAIRFPQPYDLLSLELRP